MNDFPSTYEIWGKVKFSFFENKLSIFITFEFRHITTFPQQRYKKSPNNFRKLDNFKKIK